MKKLLLYSLIVLIPGFIRSQNTTADIHQLLQYKIVVQVDSLQKLLLQERFDTAKVGIFGHLCYSFAFIRPDTGIMYGQQGLDLARKLDYKRGIAYCNQSMSFCLWAMGNYAEALQFALNSLQQYETLDDPLRVAYSYLALANVYREIRDFGRALLEAHHGLAIYDSIHFSPKVSYVVIGSIYERKGSFDSALIYLQKAYELDLKFNGGNWGFLIYQLGNIQLGLRHYELALAYYRMSLPLAIKDNYAKDVVDIYNKISKLYQETGKKDSCIYYANEILARWSFTSYYAGMMEAANTLATMFKLNNQKDSTIKYLELTMNLNKFLFNQEKERNIQNLNLNEELRRQERERASLLAQEARRKNLQLVGIAAFIFIFFIGIILLSQKESLIVMARFMSLVGLLLIFEFINLLVHPHIENIAMHNPILTLMILVALAALLVPAHHSLERLIRMKLVKAPKQRSVRRRRR